MTHSPPLPNNSCPLCGEFESVPYYQGKVRDYLVCHTCDLIHVPVHQHLSTVDEKAYYDLHDNQPDDPGYRQFLSRLFNPLNQRLASNAQGLDFGCGQGPALAQMFEEAGHAMSLYDVYYAPDQSALVSQYDFITLSEVAEHLARPGAELDNLWGQINPGGWLAIMTKRVRDHEAFPNWHYITDPTHISYFSEATFQWMAARWSSKGTPATLFVTGDDVVLFEKGG